jgi:hypothetical protein
VEANLEGHKFKDVCEVERAVTRWLVTQDTDCCQQELGSSYGDMTSVSNVADTVWTSVQLNPDMVCTSVQLNPDTVWTSVQLNPNCY